MTSIPEPTRPGPDRPAEVEWVPTEEGISEADVAERIDETPEGQPDRRHPVQEPDESGES